MKSRSRFRLPLFACLPARLLQPSQIIGLFWPRQDFCLDDKLYTCACRYIVWIWVQPELLCFHHPGSSQLGRIINRAQPALQSIATKSKYIGTCQQSHRSSHAVPPRIFDDVEEREQRERKRSLTRETTTSWTKQLPHETTTQPLYELLLPCNS
jgi:hypothetical protein